MKTLFDEVRSEQNIFSAWRHVKRSALISEDKDVRGFAATFEHEHQKHLKRIITQLREDRFEFDPVRGALKDKRKREAKGKSPRPIAIATLKNRVVQRAILQVLQPRAILDLTNIDSRSTTIVDDRLGRINEVNHSKYGVGGLLHPYGGVSPAISAIRTAIDAGAEYFFQSDIKSFFTGIRTAEVISFVQQETGDDKLVELLSRALEVHLANASELKGYAELFPKGGVGVAQGSSLSAFAGNVLLFKLDHELNAMGVTSIRYVDDILIVSPDKDALDRAISHTSAELTKLGLGLYDPSDGQGKSARGECVNSINFLGCTIQPRRCVPSAQSIKNLKSSINDLLIDSKSKIKRAVNGHAPLDLKSSFSSTLDALGRKIYGWQKSFSFCTDHQAFQEVDDSITKQVRDYQGYVERQLRKTDLSLQMMIYGIPSARLLHEKDKRRVIGRD